jgi:hypothetical protein
LILNRKKLLNKKNVKIIKFLLIILYDLNLKL